jgi:hypothetical protein
MALHLHAESIRSPVDTQMGFRVYRIVSRVVFLSFSAFRGLGVRISVEIEGIGRFAYFGGVGGCS